MLPVLSVPSDLAIHYVASNQVKDEIEASNIRWQKPC